MVTWDNEHPVVVHGFKKRKFFRGTRQARPSVQVAAPTRGLVTYTYEEFAAGWLGAEPGAPDRGAVLLLEPTPEFYIDRAAAEPGQRAGLREAVEYLLKYKRLLLQLLLGLVVGSGLQLLLPFLAQSVVDIGVNTHNLNFVYLVLIAQVLRLAGHLDSLAHGAAAVEPGRNMRKPTYFPAQLGELQAKYQVFAQACSQLYSLRAGGFFAKKEHLLRAELATLHLGQRNLTQQNQLYQHDWQLAREELASQQSLVKKGVIAAADFRREQSREIAKQFPVKQAESARLHNLTDQRAKEQELLDLAKLEQDHTDAYVQSLNTLRSALDEWKSKYVLVAPDSGRVNFAGILEVSQVVRANQEAFFISARSATYYGEMLVPQQNLGKVKVGQRVLIKLDGYPFNEYGFVNGRIAYLANIPTPRGFLAKVALTNGLRTTYGKQIVFRNRISAQADILTEDTRLLERIFYQIRLSFNSLG